MAEIRELATSAASIIGDAGGNLVGKTRLQKTAFFLKEAGIEKLFHFYYKHYGPYSDDLNAALHYAKELGLTSEEEKMANWGGVYTVFYSSFKSQSPSEARRRIVSICSEADSVQLELAATALYLHDYAGVGSPWVETARLKPTKAASENIEGAKALYHRIQAVDSPNPLPAI